MIASVSAAHATAAGRGLTSAPAPDPLPAEARVVVLDRWPDHEAVYIPPLSGRAIAIAVELHGSGLDALRQYQMSGLANRLTAAGMAVLLPRAATPFRLMPAVTKGHAWNVPGAPLPGSVDPSDATTDDVGFIAALLEAILAQLGLTDAPLFLTGYSGGARLASHLLASGHLGWTAAGLVAGLRPIINGEKPPPPTISFHGLDDTINPFAGGGGTRWDIGVEEAGRRYALSQGASNRQFTRQPNADLTVYRTSDGGEALSMYAVAGAAHAWPGTGDEDHLANFGPAGDGIDASALIADFFIARMDGTKKRTDQQGTAR